MDVTTLRTALRRMAWVYAHDLASMRLCFVGQHLSQAPKRPLVHRAALDTPVLFRAVTNFVQVLNDNRCARFYGLNDLPTDHVIAIGAKPCRLACQLPEMAFGRLRAFALKRTLQSEVPALHLLPGTLTEKSVVRGHGGSGYPEVHTDHLPIRDYLRVRQRENDMQPELPAAVNQICAVISRRKGKHFSSAGIQRHGQRQPSANRRQRHVPFAQVGGVRALVVAYRRQVAMWLPNLFAAFLPGQRTFDRLRRSHSGGNHQLGGQVRVLLSERIVRRVMQVHAVFHSMLPSIGSDGVKASGVLLKGIQQNSSLFWRRGELEAECSLHTRVVSYIARFCRLGRGVSPSSTAAKAA